MHVILLNTDTKCICLTNAEGCFVSPDGQYNVGYRGNLSVTTRGEVCQKWTVNTPHQLSTAFDLSTDGLGDHNYCRNPREFWPRKTVIDIDVWCYTTNPLVKWDYCCL